MPPEQFRLCQLPKAAYVMLDGVFDLPLIGVRHHFKLNEQSRWGRHDFANGLWKNDSSPGAVLLN